MNNQIEVRTSVTAEAFDKLIKLDTKQIGTSDYMGIAYFWNYEYRHYLRDASFATRKKIHSKMLRAGLAVDGESDAHQQIIDSLVG